MTEDPDPKVRIQLAFTLGETRDVRRLAALAALTNRFGGDPWMQAAIVSSVPDAAETLLQALVKASDLSEPAQSLAPALVGVIGARQRTPEIARVLLAVASYSGPDAPSFQLECLGILSEALKQGRYFAGQNATGWQARRLDPEVPREWTEVVVDLWQDCGTFTLTGIAPTAMGGPACFDQIELLREPPRGRPVQP